MELDSRQKRVTVHSGTQFLSPKMSVQNTNQNWPFVVNLGNSIIGVAVLAMPFCFKQCGIILGMLVLLFCTWLTLASCQLLVKAGIVSHRRSYEFLAYHTYGAPGKFLVEIGMIGMQFGTLVAQIVVIGDLGPPIISSFFGIEHSTRTRFYLIVVLCLLVGLPLGMMKDLQNVSRASTICISFYVVFTFYILWMSSDSLWSGSWYPHVNFWRPQGLFQCLPILSFSFGCQTQLFILYDALPEPSLHAIKSIIHSAVNLCAVTYLLVGFFGYITYYQGDIPGDIITVFPSTLATHLIKLGFVLSIAITFPVIIYPCRASIYTLLFQKMQKSKHSDDATSTYIPEFLFKAITVAIVLSSMTIGILIPNVEFILGLNGAITGTLICYIFPALFFLRVMSSKADGKTIAQIVLVLGLSILMVSTVTTLYTQDKGHVHPSNSRKNSGDVIVNQPTVTNTNIGAEKHDTADGRPKVQDGGEVKEDKGKRVEPPNPDAPNLDVQANVPLAKNIVDEKDDSKKTGNAGGRQMTGQEGQDKSKKKDIGDDGNIQGGVQKEVKETEQRQEELLAALEVQRREQEKLLQEQKALLQELKDHREQDLEIGRPGMQRLEAQQPPAGFQQMQLQQGVTQKGNRLLKNVHVPLESSLKQPVDVPAEDNAQQPANVPVGNPQQPGIAFDQVNRQKPENANAQRVLQPMKTPAQGNLQQAANVPVQGNIQQPANVLVQASLWQPANVPVQGNLQQMANVPVQGNIKQAANVPVQGNIQQSVNVPVQGNLQQPVNVPVQGNLQQPVNVPVQGNIQQPVNVPVQGNLQQPVNVPVQGNIQQHANVPVQGNLQLTNIPMHDKLQEPVNALAQKQDAENLQKHIQGMLQNVGGQESNQGQPQDFGKTDGARLLPIQAGQNSAPEKGTGGHVQNQSKAGDKEILLRKKRELPELQLTGGKEEMKRRLKSSVNLDSGIQEFLDSL